MKTNKQIYNETYFNCFAECYPMLPMDKATNLMQKAMETALKDIRSVNIDSPAFKATSKKLGIKHTYKAIEEFLNQKEQ